MKKLALLLVSILFVGILFSSCNSAAPSNKEALNLAKESLDIILRYTNHTPAESIKEDFPDITVTKKTPGKDIPESMGYITDLEYSEFAEKYGKIFEKNSLQGFLQTFTADQDGYLCLTGWQLVESVEISNINMTFKEKNGDNYIYYLTFDRDNVLTTPNPPTEQCKYEVTIVKTDDGFRISEGDIIMEFFNNAFT